MVTNSSDHNSQSPNQDWEINTYRLELMQQKIASKPRILSKTAGCSSCCIFRIPQSLVEVNGRAYEPHVISIGPYHHGEPKLQMMEEQKWRFLGDLLKRTEMHGLVLQDLLKAVQELESQARECYSENIMMVTDEIVEMLVLDGCFVIEVLRKFGGLIAFEADDPIYSMAWVLSFLLRDLIRLENQIPFFILQRLFDLTTFGHDKTGPNLTTLALKFFNDGLQRPDHIIEKFSNLEGKHLLDLLRSSYILPGYEEPEQDIENTPSHVIHTITKLRRAGIKLKPGKEESFLAIRFRHGVIEMPPITIDDFMSAFLYNSVAYEQCHRGYSKHMTTYTTLLDSLINTSKDVEYLCECNIFENYFGTEAEVANFINNLGKEVTFDLASCYLGKLFREVNEYYGSTWNINWASFKFTYFNTPWSFISAVAALVLLVLTILQTVYTIIGYVHPNA
ncbi:hypothetical protein Leryth_000947 [Lithospermum erythrorhizon]|nr:hypothetical protein Leryth_000947 [Lithospermum erythrorhizon]